MKREVARIEKSLEVVVDTNDEKRYEVDRRLTEQYTDLVAQYNKLDAKFVDTAAELEDATTKLNDSVNGVGGHADTFAQKTTGLQRQLNDTSVQQQVSIEDLRASLLRLTERQGTAIEDSDRMLTDKVQAIKTSLDKEMERGTDARDRLDKTLTMQLDGMSSRIDTATSSFTMQLQELDKIYKHRCGVQAEDLSKLREAETEHHHTWQSTHEAATQNVNAVMELHAARLSSQQQYIDDTCGTLELRIAEKNTRQDARIDELATAKLEHHKHFSEIFVRLEAQVVDQAAEQNAHTEGQYKHLLEHLQKADLRSNEQDRAHDIKLDELSNVISENHQRLSSICVDLESNLNEKAAAHDARLTSMNQHHTDVTTNLKESTTTKNTMQDTQAKILTERVDCNLKEIFDRFDTLMQKLDGKNRAQDELAESNFQQLAAETTTAEQRTADKLADLKTQVDGADRAMQDHAHMLKETTQSLDARIVAKFVELERRGETQHQQLATAVHELDGRLAEKFEIVHSWRDTLTETMGKHYIQATRAYEKNEQQLAAQAAKLDARLTAQMDYTKDGLGKLRASTLERLSEQETALLGSGLEVDRRHTEREVELEKKLAQLSTAGQRDQARLATELAGLELRVEQAAREAAAAAMTRDTALEGRCAELETSQEGAEIQQVMVVDELGARLREGLAEAAEIRLGMAEAAAEAEARQIARADRDEAKAVGIYNALQVSPLL
jgi:hypothetical protein